MPNESQQLTTLNYVDFTGGMNSAVPPTSLQDNEYQLIKNLEFNFNKLCTRGGLSEPIATFPSDILAVHWDEGTGEYLAVLANKTIYHITSNGETTNVGETTGNKKPVFCEYDGRVFIASGGKLQYFDYVAKTTTTISTSYNCDSVFERFGRLVITHQGDDNVYYSAVGDPYVTNTTETVITDANGIKTTVSSSTTEGSVAESSSETTVSTSTKETTTTVSLTSSYYSGAKINDLAGTDNTTGTASTKNQNYTYKVVETYKDTAKTSAVYYLNGKKSTLDKINAYTFKSVKFGSLPATTGYTQVTNDEDPMYGAVYRDSARTDGGIERTYYFDRTYQIGQNPLNVMYKRVVVKNSDGNVTASTISVPYFDFTLNKAPTEALTYQEDVMFWEVDEVEIAGGTKATPHKTAARVVIANGVATAYLVYQDEVITVTQTNTPTTTETGRLKDNKGYYVGKKYSGVVNKTITATVKNADKTVSKYYTTVNAKGVVSQVKLYVIENTHSTSNKSGVYTEIYKTTTLNKIDDGKAISVTTKVNTQKDVITDKSQVAIFSIALATSTNEQTDSQSTSTTTTVTNNSGWEDDSNDDSTSKWLEVGYKDNGDILKILPISGDIAVFKTNGRVYSISNEYPNWTVSQIAEHTDVLNAESIVNVGSNIAFMTNKGVKTLTTTAVYGNFTTDEIARKINRSLCETVYNPMIFNIIRKRQLIIVPDTSDAITRKKCYVYQYDIGAGMQMEFAIPIYDMQDTDNGVIIAGGKSLYRWSFEYEDDNGELIEQEIVSKKYVTSNRLYTRMVDIGVSGDEGETVVMKWANKTINYQIPEKRRMINVFSVCRDSVFGLYTTANISLEYIKLYIFEQ